MNKEYLQPDRCYHVYNKSVGKEILYQNDSDYFKFIELLERFLPDYVDVFCYCLMPNHFHFLIRVKSNDIFQDKLKEVNDDAVCLFVARQFGHLFNSYAQYYNKKYDRQGSLFKNRFQRKQVSSIGYLLKLVHYQHHNPVIAGLCDKPQNWKYSSFNTIVSQQHTFISRTEVLELYGDLDNFKYVHTLSTNLDDIDSDMEP